MCPHFCQHLLQSNRQPVSSKKKTATREQVGLLYKLNTGTLQKFRLPPSRRCAAVQRVDGAGSGFDCGMGVWMRVSGRESSYSAWVVDVLETVATSWEIYILADIINSPRAIFFSLRLFLSVLDTPTHTESIVPVQKIRFNTSATLEAAVEMSARCCASFQPRITRSQLHAMWTPRSLLCLFRLHFTRQSWQYNLRILKKSRLQPLSLYIEEEEKGSYLVIRYASESSGDKR